MFLVESVCSRVRGKGAGDHCITEWPTSPSPSSQQGSDLPTPLPLPARNQQGHLLACGWLALDWKAFLLERQLVTRKKSAKCRRAFVEEANEASLWVHHIWRSLFAKNYSYFENGMVNTNTPCTHIDWTSNLINEGTIKFMRDATKKCGCTVCVLLQMSSNLSKIQLLTLKVKSEIYHSLGWTTV